MTDDARLYPRRRTQMSDEERQRFARLISHGRLEERVFVDPASGREWTALVEADAPPQPCQKIDASIAKLFLSVAVWLLS